MAIRRVGIIVGGGPAPGANGVIAAAAIEAIKRGVTAIGFRDGFEWLAQRYTDEQYQLLYDEVSRIYLHGGVVLGTSRADITRDGWLEFGAIIIVQSLGEAVELANRIASEHVELMLDDPRALQPKIRNAGAIFLGHHTPEAIGDYVGGSNHVLPTARSARYASGLGVLDFMKRTSILGCDPASLAQLAPAAVTLAETEGLSAHGRSVSIRLNR